MDGCAGQRLGEGSDLKRLLRIVDATGSTNDDVLALAEEGAPEGTTVCARRQRTGRGRRGHSWISPPGGLYLSVLLRPSADECMSSGLPAAVALAALDALQALGAEHVLLKWPNDIVLASPSGPLAKLGGILVESRGAGSKAWHAVAGIGLNLVRPERESIVPARVHDGMAAPLAAGYLEDAMCGPAPDFLGTEFSDLAERMAVSIVSGSRKWAEAVSPREGPLAPLKDAYERKLAFRGDEVIALSPAGEMLARGRFAGIDSWGRARVESCGAAGQAFLPEEASLRPCR